MSFGMGDEAIRFFIWEKMGFVWVGWGVVKRGYKRGVGERCIEIYGFLVNDIVILRDI